MRKKGLLKGILVLVFILISSTFTYKVVTNDKKVDYIIELDKFNIRDDNTNAESTTIGINKALEYAKEKGYKRVKLPKGHYAIDTSVTNPIILSDRENDWTHNRQGIVMQSYMELYMDEAILEMMPTNSTHYSIFTISSCTNSKVIGGTILGDRYEHNYGMKINSSVGELESGSIDGNTGLPIYDDTKVRTKEFIDNFNGESLPEEFALSVLENTTKNTVDGGERYIYCYNENENYLGIASGGNGFLSNVQLLPGTKKIKVSFKDEKRLDAVYYITKELVYPTHEFGSGITITDSSNIEINGVTIKDTIGDCISTTVSPLKLTVDNLNIINCTLENSRRQGISLIATGENYLIKNCNIGKINGVDPQSGIDIEHYDYVKNVTIEDNNFYDNKKWDIINYNGQDIEIKNNNFTGGIGSTFGWNMNIYNNTFEYKDTKDNPKIHEGCVLLLGTNKTNEDNAYFNFNNNTIKGYKKAGGIQKLSLNEFKNNSIYDTKNLVVRSPMTSNNIYEGSEITYDTDLVENEEYKNSIVGIENDTVKTIISNSNFIESQYMPRNETTIKESTIYNKEKPFGHTSTWWNLERKVTFDNCDITTKYESDIQFLSDYYANTVFRDCTMNLSRYNFSLNYGTIEFEQCDFNFNNLNKDESIVKFDRNGYGNKGNYWKFIDCSFKSELPIKINTENIYNCKIYGEVILEK